MKAKILNQAHPEYDEHELQQWAALYDGGKAWHALARDFLPKNANEPSEIYADRIGKATYENLGGPLCDQVGAWLFSKPPEIDGIESREWLDNCNGCGVDFAAWWRQILSSALVSRRAFAWVNLPARPEGVAFASLADEQAAGVTTPFLCEINPVTVRNWGRDAIGSFAWLLFRTTTTEQEDPTAGQKTVTRWTLIDGEQIRRWEWSPRGNESINDQTEISEVLPAIQHGLGRLPVVAIELPCGLHAMGKLRDPLVGLTRTANDHDWALHVSAHALLTITTAGGAAGAPTLGAGYYLALSRDGNGSDSVGHTEPGGASNAARFERLKDQRDGVHRVVQQMAAAMSSDASATAGKSGASKQADWQSLEVMLSAYAAIVRVAMEQVLQLYAVATGENAKAYAVQGLAGWHEADLAAFVAAYEQAAPSVKSETFRRAMAKRIAAKFLPDMAEKDMRAVQAEIDSADYSDAPVYAPSPSPLDADDDAAE